MAISSALFTVRSFSSMSSRLIDLAPGRRSCSRVYMLCGTQPSGSSGPARPSMPTLAPVSFSSVSRSAMLSANVPLLGPHVGDPVLRALPVVGEHRRIDEGGRLARQRKHQHVELGVAADRAEVAGVGDVEVPHRRPAAQHEAIEARVAAISLRTAAQRRSRSSSDSVGYSVSLRMADVLCLVASDAELFQRLRDSPRCPVRDRIPACSRARRGRA